MIWQKIRIIRNIPFYDTYFLNAKSNLSTQYDYLNLVNNLGHSHSWNYTNDGQLFIAGFERNPMNGVGIPPNSRR